MAEITIEFDKQKCVIETLENEFVDYFLEKFNNLKNNEPYSRYSSYFLESNNDYDFSIRDKIVIDINKNIDYLKENYGLEFPCKAKFNMTHDLCNIIHRYFTFFTRGTSLEDIINPKHTWDNALYHKKYKNREVFNPTLQNYFKTTYSEKCWLDILHILEKINMLIHEYEDCIPDNEYKQHIRKNYNKKESKYIELGFIGSNTHNGGKDVFNMKPDWYKYTTNRHYDITIIKSILGKDYWQSFMDMDDPSNLDVVNMSDVFEPGLCIDPYGLRQRVFDSDYGINWFKRFGVPREDSIIGQMPIGNIVNDFDIDKMNKSNSNIKNVIVK